MAARAPRVEKEPGHREDGLHEDQVGHDYRRAYGDQRRGARLGERAGVAADDAVLRQALGVGGADVVGPELLADEGEDEAQAHGGQGR
jgi:hypothetical protein